MKNIYKERVLVTGCAGFIGMHLCEQLCKNDNLVLGLDNMNDYYDTHLKNKRLKKLLAYDNFKFREVSIHVLNDLSELFSNFSPDKVVNLAAQAGVRYSLENPHSYIQSNISGFMNVLECCRINNVNGLIYASSSSVYGPRNAVPFNEGDNVDSPSSIYAVTKKTNELMAKSYNELHNLKSTALRFFTVYGPWGRPDMAYYIFTKNILNGKAIKLHNFGAMQRDFTYIDDIISGTLTAIENNYDYEIINLGNNETEELSNMVKIIENILNKNAIIEMVPKQKGELVKTHANIDKAKNLLNFYPKVGLEEGLEKFIQWYIKHMNI